MSSPTPRRARAAAVVTAATLVAGGSLAAAPAAFAADPVQYTATTGTGVVDLVLTLPAALPAVPGLPNPIELTLLGTQGQAVGKTTGADTSRASSFLAGGNLVTDSPLSALLAPLSRTVTATLASPSPASGAAIAVPDNPLGLGLDVGDQTAAVTKLTGANKATSQVAQADLGSLGSLGLGALLDPLFGGLNTAVSTLVTQAAPLTSGLSAIPALPSIPVPNPLAPVLGGPATIPTPTVGGSTVAATVNELPARIAALEKQLRDGAVVHLNALDTSESVVPTATQVVASGRAKLASADLFGGLVTVDATEAVATAKAASTKSAASSDASATLVQVHVADSFGELLNAVASDKGITAGLLGGSLGMALDPTVRPTVAAVDGALNTVLAQLTGLLQSLGGGAQLIQQGTVTKTVSADGRKAEAHASPALVSVGLPVAPNLVRLAIGKADAVAAVTPAAVTAPPAEPAPQSLPRTGGDTGAGLVALLLAGGGLVLYRRRRTA
ncbi:MAG: hypothetical protein JWN17_99 [Frankiales bacterium]|nr:hypothetical protein [Frankiales bacterium]